MLIYRFSLVYEMLDFAAVCHKTFDKLVTGLEGQSPATLIQSCDHPSGTGPGFLFAARVVLEMRCVQSVIAEEAVVFLLDWRDEGEMISHSQDGRQRRGIHESGSPVTFSAANL